MNIERLKVIRDYLKFPPVDRTYGFNMRGWEEAKSSRYNDLLGESKNECGTVCCIAGLASVLYPEMSDQKFYDAKAAEILGLSDKQANELFFGGPNDLVDITVDMAIDVLDGFIETGEVNWIDVEYSE